MFGGIGCTPCRENSWFSRPQNSHFVHYKTSFRYEIRNSPNSFPPINFYPELSFLKGDLVDHWGGCLRLPAPFVYATETNRWISKMVGNLISREPNMQKRNKSGHATFLFLKVHALLLKRKSNKKLERFLN